MTNKHYYDSHPNQHERDAYYYAANNQHLCKTCFTDLSLGLEDSFETMQGITACDKCERMTDV